MKAISIQQPWLYLILKGIKTIETRKWKTDYRGDILLCSSQTIDKLALIKLNQEFINVYHKQIDTSEPYFGLGQALAVANLYDVKPMQENDFNAARCPLYDGAYSFFLKDIRIIKPFDVSGQLRLFDVPDELIQY